jgi:hypothetical protein
VLQKARGNPTGSNFAAFALLFSSLPSGQRNTCRKGEEEGFVCVTTGSGGAWVCFFSGGCMVDFLLFGFFSCALFCFAVVSFKVSEPVEVTAGSS